MSSEIISILSLTIGIGGIIFALIQYRSRIRVSAMLKSELAATLNRIKIMVPYKRDLEELVDKVENPELVKWIWMKYQGLSDLYVMMVSHYLSFERRFTYDDLKKLIENEVISTKWEEGIWGNLIAQRPENRNVTVPKHYIS